MTELEKKQLQALTKAAHAGGEMLRKYFGQILTLKEKSTVADFQTEADIASEQAILKILKTEFPEYNILTEEEGETKNNSDYTFVIDPLDGTNNFILGIANFSVSIALFYKDEAIAGVVYQPVTEQTYSAVKGKGAYLNGEKINVSTIVDNKKITIGYTCGYKNSRDVIASVLHGLIKSEHKRIIFSWSPAYDYCLLASGKIESVVTDSGIEIYDFGAGKLIASEAGAKIIDFSGNKEQEYENNRYIISNLDETNEYILGIIKSL